MLEKIVQKMHAGDWKAAAKLSKAGFRKYKREVRFAKAAGISYFNLDRFNDAVTFLNAALKLDSNDPEIKHYLSAAVIGSGHPEKIIPALRKWLTKSPEDTELLYLLASALAETGAHEETIEFAHRGLGITPRMTKLRAILGLALYQLDRFEEAEVKFATTAEEEPKNPENWHNLSSARKKQQKGPEALEAARKAYHLAPTDHEIATSFIHLALECGAFDEVRAELKKIIKLHPSDEYFAMSLVSLATEQTRSEVIEQLQKSLESRDLSGDRRTHVGLMLAKQLLRDGQSQKALELFANSNARRAKSHPYIPENAERDFDRTKELVTAYQNAARDFEGALPSAKPVFVIGQPRSGTTLCEMVLTGHSQVQGFGELDAANDAVNEVLAGKPLILNDHLEAYRPTFAVLKPETVAFVDKTPRNYTRIGQLAELFPHARFINIVRDPREAAFSMWQEHFTGTPYFYTSRMDWLAHAANLYRRYINFWVPIYGDRILTITYQDLVSDLEGTSKLMADFCGFKWEDGMLHPEKNTALVKTASQSQVRKSVSTSSLGKWRNYPGLLDEFQANLDPELWPEFDL